MVSNYGKASDMQMVAIYPKEGTFWADHPVGLVQQPWVTPEKKEAANAYIDYLLAEPQQRRAMEFGFRPALTSIPVGEPIAPSHGVDAHRPKTVLDMPSYDVAQKVLDLGKEQEARGNRPGAGYVR